MNKSVRPVAIGIDSGGTGTRVVCADEAGIFASASGGPSALARGLDAAWDEIRRICDQAFASAGRSLDWAACSVAIGISGGNNAGWRNRFIASAPDVRSLRVETDGFTTLFGAHGGQPGAIVAIGTGSVAEALYADGTRREVGGYGFPASDEASGAWIGMRATHFVQKGIDGRGPCDAYFDALSSSMGVQTQDDLVSWLAEPTPAEFATLAPTVLDFTDHPHAKQILLEAGDEIAAMIDALSSDPTFPVALCGGLGARLRPYVPEHLHSRLVEPQADSTIGALRLAQLETRGYLGIG